MFVSLIKIDYTILFCLYAKQTTVSWYDYKKDSYVIIDVQKLKM